MNKRRYRFHPGDYELGENERFYGDMEARGWRLVSRGAYLSRFERAEPSAARYRVEVSDKNYYAYLSDEDMDDGQIAVFADCGWEFVTGRRLLRIFRAPAGSGAPEFYMDPRQQADTLRTLHRQYLTGWIPTVSVVTVNLLLSSVHRGGLALLRRAWVEETALALVLLLVLAWLVYASLHGAWRVGRVIRRMKRGQSLDHSPRRRRLGHRIVSGVLAALLAGCAALAAAQRLETRREELPLLTTEPYLLLRDLGCGGERDEESRVTRSSSLLADHWDVWESVDGAWMLQDVYRLRSAGDAMGLAQALMETAVFGRGGGDFVPMDPGGLDAAWTTNSLEMVAVKGRLVACITSAGVRDGLDPAAVREALERKWE